MFPYLDVDVFRAGPLRLSLIRLLLGAGILLGYFLLVRRARSRGMDISIAQRLALAMIIPGFAGAHFFKLLYFENISALLGGDPLAALAIFSGSASFGGLFGALAGGCFYLRRRGIAGRRMLAWFDVVAFVFPAAWVFGRFGCYLAHDHPGIRTASWLGVQYPGGTRFDLGLIEVFFTLLLLAAFLIVDRARRPEGFYLSAFLVAYGVFRFGLDSLHVDPVRYFGISVDQWASGCALLLGLMVAASGKGLVSEVTRCETDCSPA